MEEDGRLLPMLCSLSKRYLGQDYGSRQQNVGVVTADMIDMVILTSVKDLSEKIGKMNVFICTNTLQIARVTACICDRSIYSTHKKTCLDLKKKNFFWLTVQSFDAAFRHLEALCIHI